MLTKRDKPKPKATHTKQPRNHIMLRMPADVHAHLKFGAYRRGMTMTAYLRMLVPNEKETLT